MRLFLKNKKGRANPMNFEEIMDLYEKNPKHAMNHAIKELDRYIYKKIHTNYKTYYLYYEDLYQEACMAVIENMKNYDPKVSRPTTFFTFYINSNLSKFITEDVRQSNYYYHKNYEKVCEIEDFYEMNHKILTDQQIAKETGLTIKAIKTAREVDGKNLISLESLDIDAILPSEEETPEIKMEKSETYEKLYQSIQLLPWIEREVILKDYFKKEYSRKLKALNYSKEEFYKYKRKAMKHLREMFQKEILFSH